MISTTELFKLIENYLFAFSSKEEAIKVIFNDDIKSFTKMDQKDIEKKINKNLSKYFKTQFENNKLPELTKNYLNTRPKVLSKIDILFLDSIINDSNYEITFEDAEDILKNKKIKSYLKKHKEEDEIDLVDTLIGFQEVNEEKVTYDENYVPSDIMKLYNKDISRYSLLTQEEEREYIRRYQETKDPEALDILVCSNQGLCKKVASKYIGRGLPLLDLIQEGNIGLMKGLDKFDLKRKTKLSTYAMWWIRQSIKKAVAENSTTIRLPQHVRNDLKKIADIEEEFFSAFGRNPTVPELATVSGLTEDKVYEIKRNDIRMVSFDKKIDTDDGDGSTIGDFITTDMIATPDEYEEEKVEREIYESILHKIGTDTREKDPARDEQVIRLRYGIEIYNEETYRIIEESGLPLKDGYILEDVGKMFGVTRERIRQIETRVVIKLGRYGTMYRARVNLNEQPIEVKPRKKYTKRKKKKEE